MPVLDRVQIFSSSGVLCSGGQASTGNVTQLAFGYLHYARHRTMRTYDVNGAFEEFCIRLVGMIFSLPVARLSVVGD